MFNKFGQQRPFTPSNPPSRPVPSQASGTSGAQSNLRAQIKPDFLGSSSTSGGTSGFTRPSRTASDSFTSLSPQSQRSALYDQARTQAKEAFQSNYRSHTGVSGALPGGLSERQRMEFETLKRTNPLAAEKQLLNYKQNADIRYNKPGMTSQAPQGSGLTYRRPPTNPSGPRRSFGK
ncbi:MAG: hypothetical protein WAQ24_01260 [Candidatus Saccharimonadales bacterium]